MASRPAPQWRQTNNCGNRMFLVLFLSLAFTEPLRSSAFALGISTTATNTLRNSGSGSSAAFIGGGVASLRVGDRNLGLGTGAARRKAGAVNGVSTMRLQHKMKKKGNTPGEFFVDESCVDCDICRWMDPLTFKRYGFGAIVASQPVTKEERMKVFQAMLACPTGSIRTMVPDKMVEDALKTFPIPVDKERLPGIYQLAPTTKASMGNTPYLIVRPRKKGNIMIDVPRYLKKTAAQVEALGGVKYLITTKKHHCDGHEAWKKKFPDMTRILHRMDLVRNTRIMEERLDGKGPWFLVRKGKESPKAGYVTGDTARFDFVRVPKKDRAPKDPAVKIIGLPGQSRGSVGVIYEMKRKDGVIERVGFSGATVGFSSHKQQLDAFTRESELDKETVGSSIRLLAKEGITALLPGKGARVLYDSAEEAEADLEAAAEKAAAASDFSNNYFLFGNNQMNQQPF